MHEFPEREVDELVDTINVDVHERTEILPEMVWVQLRLHWKNHDVTECLGRAFQRHRGYWLVYPKAGHGRRAWEWVPDRDVSVLPANEAPSESFW